MLDKIIHPTFLVNQTLCERNISEMASKAQKAGVSFRPHLKTPLSAEISDWYRKFGVESVTVSSIDMAEYFINHGWKDVLIAFPFNPRAAEQLNKLAQKARIGVLIESEEALMLLEQKVKTPVHYHLKIDVGTGRTGIKQNQFSRLKNLLPNAASIHQLGGLVAHAGHAYQQLDFQQAKEIFESSKTILKNASTALGLPEIHISYGDTPTCSLLNQFEGIHEIRPGNFVFYDLMQVSFGACQIDQIAVCMACPIVAIHHDRNELIVHGGAVHLSKDYIIDADGSKCFGSMVELTNEGWKTHELGKVVRLSQEHGIIQVPSAELEKYKIGDLVGILPVHSCLTANLQPHFMDTRGAIIEKFNLCQV